MNRQLCCQSHDRLHSLMRHSLMHRQLRWTLVRASFVLLIVLYSAPAAMAGKYNSTRNIGDKVVGWTQLPGVDDQKHSLGDLDKYPVVVVVFTCNSCPYAVDYEQRINDLARQYSAPDAQVAVVAINSNTIEADLLPAMKQRAQERGFVFPYLFDQSQRVAKAFGAVRTPEFFVLDKERRIVYMGAMDDHTQADQVTTRYLQMAIDATLRGQSVENAETPPVGCAIRFARERRKP